MKHDRPETRTVHVGHRAGAALGDEAYVPEKHIDNRVISSKVCFRGVAVCVISRGFISVLKTGGVAIDRCIP